MRKVRFYSLPLFGHQFQAECANFGEFSSKFQTYVKKKYGIVEKDALAVWYAGKGGEEFLNMGTKEEIEERAQSVIGKIPNEGIIDITIC